VTALKQAAIAAISSYNTTVYTEITSGDAAEGSGEEVDDEEGGGGGGGGVVGGGGVGEVPLILQRTSPHQLRQPSVDSDGSSPAGESNKPHSSPHDYRKHSIVSISTTISTRSEPMSPGPTRSLFASTSGQGEASCSIQDSYSRLGPIPYLRSCLLLAQMSSEDNLLTEAYTQKCVEIGRQNRDFVLGFIAMRSLNTTSEDNFLTLTPGVKLVEGDGSGGDGLGQQYQTPRKVVLEHGTDIIIVGRGIISQDDRVAVAERYRQEAWSAYETRIGARP
jgi:uridine monophosphate synthetase